MTALDRILLTRAEEQIAAWSWPRRSPPDLSLPVPTCATCGGPMSPSTVLAVCTTCRKREWMRAKRIQMKSTGEAATFDARRAAKRKAARLELARKEAAAGDPHRLNTILGMALREATT